MRLVQRMKKQPRHWYMVKKEGVEGGLVGYQKKRRWGGNVRMGVDMFLKRVLGDQNSLGVGS